MFVIEAKFNFVTICFKLKMSMSWPSDKQRQGKGDTAQRHIRKNDAKGQRQPTSY